MAASRLLILLLAGASLFCTTPDDVPAAPPAPAPADTAAIRLAITIDDLPWVGPLPAGESTPEAAIDRIAAVLRAHDAPATGFVVCDRARDNVLQSWAAWGLDLANHSAAHRDLNVTPVDEWIEDVRRCEDYLERFGEAHTKYFRFPMLHQGHTTPTRNRVSEALDEMDLETAHVTVDNSEWILTQAHAQALDEDSLRHAVGRAFVDHIVAAVRHADGVARRKTGRSVPHILLLHANTLVDDQLDALLMALRTDGVEFISLDEALADPIYDRADEYVGPKGLSWLYRMQPLSIEDVEWDDAQADAIRARFASFSP